MYRVCLRVVWASCDKNFGNDEVSFFVFVLQNQNLILARPGALRHNHVTYSSPFQINNESKKWSSINGLRNACTHDWIITYDDHERVVTLQWNLRLRPPLVSDHLSSATSFPKYQKFPSQIAAFRTSCKRPPLVTDRDHF